MQLLEEQDKQSKLEDWMEYQDYELRRQDFPHFEGVQELEFAKYYSLVDEWCCKVARAEGYKELERLAEKRMKIAESADLGKGRKSVLGRINLEGS